MLNCWVTETKLTRWRSKISTIKPTETKEVIAQRCELCEDFAQMLVDRAQTRQWELGITEDDVLQRIGAGLEGSEVFSAAERGWVMTRLAELLGWAVRRASGGGEAANPNPLTSGSLP